MVERNTCNVEVLSSILSAGLFLHRRFDSDHQLHIQKDRMIRTVIKEARQRYKIMSVGTTSFMAMSLCSAGHPSFESFDFEEVSDFDRKHVVSGMNFDSVNMVCDDGAGQRTRTNHLEFDKE